MKIHDVIIVGAGFAGSLWQANTQMIIKKYYWLKRKIILAGNAYDYLDDNGALVHEYGPHLFHTNIKEVVDYLSKYTSFYPYEQRVRGLINNAFVPIPFNLNSIEELFDKEKTNYLKEELIKEYRMEKKVPILELRKSDNKDVKELADFIFENVFKYYTMKQWYYSIDKLSNQVSDRVPVFVSYDDRYFPGYISDDA